MKSLCAYILNGEVLGTELKSWSNESLSGSMPFIICDSYELSALTQYADISSIENWSLFGNNVLSDYQELQKSIRLAGYIKGWSACTNNERDIIIDFYANPQINTTGNTQNNQMIVHLMTTKGMTQSQAIEYIVDRWWDYWTKFLGDCDTRWRAAVKVTIKYLNFSDASDLFDEVETLVNYYLNSGRLGSGYGDTRDGLVNYIMSNGMYVGNGLEENAYALKTGTWSEFKEELKKTLVSRYFWDEIEIYINNLM